MMPSMLATQPQPQPITSAAEEVVLAIHPLRVTAPTPLGRVHSSERLSRVGEPTDK